MNENQKITLTIVIGAIIIIGLLMWSARRDEQIMKAGTEYENCIKSQYHQTPADYYVTNGSYPECKK